MAVRLDRADERVATIRTVVERAEPHGLTPAPPAARNRRRIAAHRSATMMHGQRADAPQPSTWHTARHRRRIAASRGSEGLGPCWMVSVRRRANPRTLPAARNRHRIAPRGSGSAGRGAGAEKTSGLLVRGPCASTGGYVGQRTGMPPEMLERSPPSAIRIAMKSCRSIPWKFVCDGLQGRKGRCNREGDMRDSLPYLESPNSRMSSTS